MTVETCETLFPTTNITHLLTHRDSSVRRIAIQLIGKKCSLSVRNVWSLIDMWGDKQAKVKKEVMDALGDFGKLNKMHRETILNSSLNEDINSIIVWKNLSYSWQSLIIKTIKETQTKVKKTDEKAYQSSSST